MLIQNSCFIGKLKVFFLYLIIVFVMYAQSAFFGKTLSPDFCDLKQTLSIDLERTRADNSFPSDLLKGAFSQTPIEQYLGLLYRKFQLPEWNPYQGTGFPIGVDSSFSAFFPFQIIKNALPFCLWDYLILLRFVIAAFFVFLFFKLFGIEDRISFLGGIFYSLSGIFTWNINGDAFSNSAMMLAVCFYVLERLILLKQKRYLIEAVIGFTFFFLAGNLGATFYGLIFLLLYWFFRISSQNSSIFKRGGEFLALIFISFCISSFFILPNIRYFFNCYSSEFLLSIAQKPCFNVYDCLTSLVIPSFFNFYRHILPIPVEGIADHLGSYTGISMIFLSLLGIRVSGEHKRIFVFFLLCGLGFLLASVLFIRFMPLINIFLSTNTLAPVWSFCFSAASVLSLEMLLKQKNVVHKRWVCICLRFCIIALTVLLIKVSYVPVFTLFKGFESKDFYFAGIGGVIAAFIFLFILAFIFSKHYDKEQIINSVILLSLLELWFCIPKGTGCIGHLLKFIPLFLGLLTVLLVLCRKRKAGIYVFACCALLSVLIDLYSPMGFTKRHNIFKEPEFVSFLKKDNEAYHRIMGCSGILFPNFASVFGLQDVRYTGNSVPASFKYYVDNYLNSSKSLNKGIWFTGIVENDSVYQKIAGNLIYYSFLGVKYFLIPKNFQIEWPLIYNKEIKIYKNPRVLPRTYVVHNIKFAENFEYAQAQIAKIAEVLDVTAYIEGIPPDWFKNIKFGQKSSSEIEEYKPSKIKIKADLKEPGLLVLTDLYYPGWKVYVDGNESQIYRVNGLVRGVFARAGEHKIVYRYSQFSWKTVLLFIFGIFLLFTPIIKIIRLMENRLRSRRYLLCGIFIAVLPFIIYANSLSNNFLAGDDEEIIQRNIYLDDWKYLPNFFTENYKQGSGIISNYWRPFQLIVYSIIAHLGGRRAPIFHFSSLFFHSLCGIFLFLILLKLFSKRTSLSLLLLTSAIWLVHPVHNEEMSLISGIASSAHIFWILLGIYAFLFFLEKSKKLWYAVSLGSCIISLTCKEAAIVFPGLILAVHIVAVKLGLAEKKNVKEYAVLHWPFWMSMFLYVLLRLTVLNFSDTLNFYSEDNIFTQNFMYRIYTCFTVIGHGIWITLFPFSLYPDRSWSIYTSIFTPRVYWSFLAVAGFIFCALKSFRKNPLVSFGIFWFLFSYIPMSNIAAKINSLVWDHWFCLPSIGAFIIVAAFSSMLKNKRIIQGLLVFVLIVFSTVTFFRNMCWKDTETRARFILAYQPQTAKEWNNLGMVLAEKGDSEHAIQAYKRSIELSDTYSQTHHNLANIYRNEGLYDKAEEEYLKALKLDKSFYHSYLGLGELYLLKKDRKMAVDFFKKALNIYPHLPNIRAFIEEDE